MPLRTSAVSSAGRDMLLFFVRVNQVLVRLWARAMFLRVQACANVPLSHCMSDRMFLPLGVDSHGRIASVQRRVKGFLPVSKRASVEEWVKIPVVC